MIDEPLMEAQEAITSLNLTDEQVTTLIESVEMLRDDVHHISTFIAFLVGLCIVFIAFYFLKR